MVRRSRINKGRLEVVVGFLGRRRISSSSSRNRLEEACLGHRRTSSLQLEEGCLGLLRISNRRQEEEVCSVQRKTSSHRQAAVYSVNLNLNKPVVVAFSVLLRVSSSNRAVCLGQRSRSRRPVCLAEDSGSRINNSLSSSRVVYSDRRYRSRNPKEAYSGPPRSTSSSHSKAEVSLGPSGLVRSNNSNSPSNSRVCLEGLSLVVNRNRHSSSSLSWGRRWDSSRISGLAYGRPVGPLLEVRLFYVVN